MTNLLYFIIAVVMIVWAIGYFGYAAGGFIHLLIVVAVMALIIRIIASFKSAN